MVTANIITRYEASGQWTLPWNGQI